MPRSLQELIEDLEAYLPKLAGLRKTSPIANDMYEAADDWRHLGRRALENDTRVNYPQRARGEYIFLGRLREFLNTKTKTEQEAYEPLLQTGGALLAIVGEIQPPKDGHLGFLRFVREQFAFLTNQFGFFESACEPTSIRFSSGSVYVELSHSVNPWLSCQFGPDRQQPDGHCFGIHDLLYVNHDDRYKSLPERLELMSEAETENWFSFLADIFKQYGRPVLSNEPGAFPLLAGAQAERDAAFVRAMELKHSHS